MIWKTLLAAFVFIGLCVIGLCFNIIFRKNGKFPETEISRNPEMRKRGIRCVKEEEMIMLRKQNGGRVPTCAELGCSDCAGCDFLYPKDKKEEKI